MDFEADRVGPTACSAYFCWTVCICFASIGRANLRRNLSYTAFYTPYFAF